MKILILCVKILLLLYWWWRELKNFLQICKYIFYIFYLLFPKRITLIYYWLYEFSWKFWFIPKAIINQVIPNFDKVKGHFPQEELCKGTKRKLSYEHLSKHCQNLKTLFRNMNKAKRFYQQILLTFGANFCRYRIFIDRKLSEHLLFLKAKNKPLQNLLAKRSTKKKKKNLCSSS